MTRSNNFDFLRLLAAFGVVLCHSYLFLGRIEEDPLHKISYWYLGETSLSIFFLISGYLICMSYQKRPENYWRGRFLRIFPALFFNILLLVFILGPVFTNLSYAQYFTLGTTYQYLLNLFILPTIRYLPGVFTTNLYDSSVNGSVWTLASEVWLYFYIWLAGSLGFSFKKSIPLMLIILSILYLCGFNYYMRSIGDALVTIYPDFEMAAFFLIGAGFYTFKIKTDNHLVLLVLFIASIAAGYYGYKTLSLYTLLPYLVFYFAFNPKIKLQNSARFGDFSYGVYIYAYPVQQALIATLHDLTPLLLFTYTAAIALILAFASWHLVEKNALKLKNSP